MGASQLLQVVRMPFIVPLLGSRIVVAKPDAAELLSRSSLRRGIRSYDLATAFRLASNENFFSRYLASISAMRSEEILSRCLGEHDTRVMNVCETENNQRLYLVIQCTLCYTEMSF
jgi:hypothetical protein